jgi:hypothetical protein
MAFDPCGANLPSLCPTKPGVPFSAEGVLNVETYQIAGIPSIAYSIPDFEGYAVLRMFSNETHREAGCLSASITNGASFDQAPIIGSIIGVFVFLALAASFLTAIYGDSIPEARKHYAHSMSVLVVFAVLHHIYFTGALSMNWPSVLVAFWHNYAWAGGMIYSESMQNSINSFIGYDFGNTSTLGAANPSTNNAQLGGGFDIHAIYQGLAANKFLARSVTPDTLVKRARRGGLITDYGWNGNPTRPGLPLPGNFSGFAGTLSEEAIPASNAFMTGFLWLLILILLIAGAIAAFKWAVEGLVYIKLASKERVAYFRSHWIGFIGLATLRILQIAFFMMIFLCLFQFSYGGPAGVTALAAIIFILFFAGLFGMAGYACFYRVRFGHYVSEPDRLLLEKRKAFGVVPWVSLHRASQVQDVEKSLSSIPFWRITHVGTESGSESLSSNIHDDEEYTKRFGWLVSRFRQDRWWFFLIWLAYEFIRACFYGGAVGHPKTQVFGLLAVETISFIAMIMLRPFEGQRLNAILVYVLGFSKVLTVALASAFDTSFNLNRITTTIIGIVIIIVQSLLTLILLVMIVLGLITSWMSLKRKTMTPEFHPQKLAGMRKRFFVHIGQELNDPELPTPLPSPEVKPPPPIQRPAGIAPDEPYFAIGPIRRQPKIEDEDADFQSDIQPFPPLHSRHSSMASQKQPPPQLQPQSPTSNDSNTDLPASTHSASGRLSQNAYRRASASDSPFHTGTTPSGAGPSHARQPSNVRSTRSSVSSIGPAMSSAAISPPPAAATAAGAGRSSHSRARATSMQSQHSASNVPFGARVHRSSWSTRDFDPIETEGQRFRPSSRTNSLSSANVPAEGWMTISPRLERVESAMDVERS